MNTSMLADELAQLQEQIEHTRKKYDVLEGELRVVEAELETFSADRQRFDAVRDVCTALDKLGELKLLNSSGKESRRRTMSADTWNGRGGGLPALRGRSTGFWKNKRLSRSRSTDVGMN